MKYKITKQVSTEPISLEEARSHLRISPFGNPPRHPDDSYIEYTVSASREWCEQYLNRALATQTITMVLSEFPRSGIKLPLNPVQSIISISYLDKNNALQTISANDYYLDSFDGVIYFNDGYNYPSISSRENSIIINYIAGYADGSNKTPIPFPIKAAILLLVANFYENRQQDQLGSTKVTFNSLPMGIYNLLQPYRLNLGV